MAIQCSPGRMAPPGRALFPKSEALIWSNCVCEYYIYLSIYLSKYVNIYLSIYVI